MKKLISRILKGFGIVLASLVAVILLFSITIAIMSFIGRVDSSTVLSGETEVRLHIPHTITTLDRFVHHQPLEEILSDPHFASASASIASVRESGILTNPLIRFFLNGPIDTAVFSDATVAFVYDAALISPLLRFAPLILSRLDIEGLSYNKTADIPRFEYQVDGVVLCYIAVRANLVVVSLDEYRFETAMENQAGESDTAHDEVKLIPAAQKIARESDISLELDSSWLVASAGAGNPAVTALLSGISLPGRVTVAVSFDENRARIDVVSPVTSDKPALQTILTREPRLPRLLSRLPLDVQYSTLLSAGTAPDLLAAAMEVSDQGLADSIESADSACKSLFGQGLDELFFSWTGDEFALFGLEGRPKPVIAVKIADEGKRKTSFTRLFSTAFLNEDSSLVLEGIRIPRLSLPSFLEYLVASLGLSIPSPYFVVEDGFLFLSESPENLVVTVSSLKKGDPLIKGETWKTLAAGGEDRAQVSLFYSLDRTVPFFIKGNAGMGKILQLYRQGLLRVRVNREVLTLSLSLIPGAGKGIAPLPGFPVSMDGRLSRSSVLLQPGKAGDSRLVCVSGNRNVLSYNPAKATFSTFEGNDPVWIISDPTFTPRPSKKNKDEAAEVSPEEAALWIVSSTGEIHLVNSDVQTVTGFPLVSGIRPSAEPVSYKGVLYLVNRDSQLVSIDVKGNMTQVSLPFTETLRSPPALFEQGKKSLLAAYPKSFIGALHMFSLEGNPEAGWPVYLDGIAFGSPVPVVQGSDASIAFITQAGILSLYDMKGVVKQGFPLSLTGVFYSQPVFDGKSLWLISSTGTLYRVALDGSYLSHKIPDFSAEQGFIIIHDIDKDDEGELFVGGDGAILCGYRQDFTPLAGFPLPLWGIPNFSDINGDGRLDVMGTGLDGKLYAWQFR